MSDKSVFAEIYKLIRERLKDGPVHMDVVTTEIMSLKGAIEGENADFYRVCTYRQVKQLVKRAVDKFEPGPTTDPQLVMDGFEHLSQAYPLKRKGDLVLVPVELCSDIELLARAEELIKMGKGSIAHAAEIKNYVRSRQGVAA